MASWTSQQSVSNSSKDSKCLAARADSAAATAVTLVDTGFSKVRLQLAQMIGYLGPMLIRLTKLTNDRHRFEIVRSDGTRESHELETRSTLLHDLAHYAVETEAELAESFYGRLAQGMAYEALTLEPATPEAMQTEAVVVLLQGTCKDGGSPKTDAEQCAREIIAGFRSVESQPPDWVTPDFVARARDCLRRVQGQWRATPFHQTMELEFSLPSDGDPGLDS
jgi:hypothetical protein